MTDVLTALENTIRLARNSEDMKKHLDGFVRTDRGSYVEGLDTLGRTLAFLRDMAPSFVEVSHAEVNAECPGAAREPARYFRAEMLEGFTGMESVVLIGDLVAAGRLDEVRVRDGAHGPEFYIPGEPKGLGEKPTDNVWIILGPSEAGEVVWTWYPGRMTAGTALCNHAVKLNS